VLLAEHETVQQACCRMGEHCSGSVLVVDDLQRLTGIFTGRDAVRTLAEGKNAEVTTLADAMTPNPITITPDCCAIDALREMSNRGFRHLPVVESGRIWGVVSRSDFMGMEIDRLDEGRSLVGVHPLNVLIIYGTTEGHTRKIAEWTATHIRECGHKVELRDSAMFASDSDFATSHAFIVAASVHQKQHQETVTAFVIAHRKLLNAKPSAFISVSLSAVLEEGQTEAQEYVDRFVSVTDWKPRMTLLLGGALRFTEYDYFQEQIVKFIVLKAGSAASAGRDREFTDWNTLASFVDQFLQAAA
jgi:menaquinone-dependent protoporphyrinogen oxidase